MEDGQREGTEAALKIYLDDIRPAPTGWVLAKSATEFMQLVNKMVDEKREITHISLDHDLAEDHYRDHAYGEFPVSSTMNGYGVAKWLVETHPDVAMNATIGVHSMNPAGAENIRNVLRDFYKQRGLVWLALPPVYAHYWGP